MRRTSAAILAIAVVFAVAMPVAAFAQQPAAAKPHPPATPRQAQAGSEFPFSRGDVVWLAGGAVALIVAGAAARSALMLTARPGGRASRLAQGDLRRADAVRPSDPQPASSR